MIISYFFFENYGSWQKNNKNKLVRIILKNSSIRLIHSSFFSGHAIPHAPRQKRGMKPFHPQYSRTWFCLISPLEPMKKTQKIRKENICSNPQKKLYKYFAVKKTEAWNKLGGRKKKQTGPIWGRGQNNWKIIITGVKEGGQYVNTSSSRGVGGVGGR